MVKMNLDPVLYYVYKRKVYWSLFKTIHLYIYINLYLYFQVDHFLHRFF